MILTAHQLGYNGITLTDHEALCGHIDWLTFEQELKKENKIPENFKCALGNEIYLTDTREPVQKYFHFILIAKNSIGHKALRELSSNSWLQSYRARGLERVPTLKKELEFIVNKYPNSLIATTACIGGELGYLVGQLIEIERQKGNEIEDIKIKIDKFITWCKSLFKDDFYIEIAPGDSKPQQEFNNRVKNIANFYNIKMVIGTDAHYLTSKWRPIHKAFLNAKEGEREVDSFYYNAHLMNNEEAYANLKKFYTEEEFDQLCLNSQEIYNKIQNYQLFHNPIIPEVQVQAPLPRNLNYLEKYPVLQQLMKSNNPQERKWINECISVLEQKQLINETYLNRLELEADILSYISEKLNNCLFSYFNTFQHYINLFWECGSVVGPGRGSAGSFLSNYLIGITQLDPIEWNLPYFRFLNKERAELPKLYWAIKSW